MIMIPQLIIYTGNNCPYSKRLKDFLYNIGMPFEEKIVNNNLKITNELQMLDKELRTPIMKITSEKEEILIGWNEENKQKLLNIMSNYLK